MSRNLPLVSIVTPCLNRADYVETTIEAVNSQTYPLVEHIIADGGSTDGTIEILRRHQGHVNWNSEPDQGYADALNKCLSQASGDVIGWINTDDIYLPGAIARAVEILEADPDLDLFYGTCLLIDANGNTIGRHATKSFDVNRLIWYDPGYFTTQSMFFRRRVLDRVGGFDPDLKYAADYDWLIRVGKRCRVRYVPECLAAFRIHQDALQGKAHHDRYSREVVAVSRRHGGRWVTPIRYHVFASLSGLPSLLSWASSAKQLLVRLGLPSHWF